MAKPNVTDLISTIRAGLGAAPQVQPPRGPQALRVNQPIRPNEGLIPDSVHQAPGYQADDLQGAGGNLNIQPAGGIPQSLKVGPVEYHPAVGLHLKVLP